MSADAFPILALSAGRPHLSRLVLPAAGVLVFAAFALLWLGGWHALYLGIQGQLGLNPYQFPFLDTHALLSAAECQRQGVNVYLENPCDVLGRVHAYSPLWLTLIPGFLGTGDTTAVGLGFALSFILAIGLVLRPRSWAEIAVFGVATLSPATLFAVERGNNDLVIFVLLAAAGLLWAGSERARLVSYALCLAAGLLKYFPMVAFALVLRERWRRGFAVAAAAAIAVALLILDYRAELWAALANIPAGHEYFGDVFSARNLPLGIVALMGGGSGAAARIIPPILFLLLGAATVSRSWRIIRLLEPARIEWDGREMALLATASLLFPACFFTAQNIAYRCIYLLLALPGLLRLRGSTEQPMLRRGLTQMIVLSLVMTWECAISFNIGVLLKLSPDLAGSGVFVLLQGLYWLGRELLWWWLIAGFLGLAASCLLNQPLTAEILGWLRRLLPAPSRR